MMIFKIPTLMKRFSKRKRKQALNKTHYGVMYAVMNEDEGCLLSAIKAGAPLNSRIDLEDTSVAGDLDSKAPLHWVASRGNVNFLKVLLQAGADPNVRGTWSGRTPLLECSDNIECTRLLLAAGGDVNSRDSDGNTVLHYAAGTDSFSYLQFRYLIQCGALVDVSNTLGETPLHKLCSYSTNSVQRAKAVNLCIKNRCKVNAVDYNGRTALHIAASHCNEECAQMLLRGGAVVDAADYDGMTPLHFASRRRGGEGCVAILLNSGAEPDYESTNCGYAALQLAVQHNNVATVRLLLHYGARPMPYQSYSNEICRKSCCVRHISCHAGSFRQNEDDSVILTASQLIVSNALRTVPSLQSLCRLSIRRQAGPTRLHNLLVLQQPPDTGYLTHHSNKPLNVTTPPIIKREVNSPAIKREAVSPAIKQEVMSPTVKRLTLSNNNLDTNEKYETISASCPGNLGNAGNGAECQYLPSSIRRYLLHCDEYDHWWDIRRKNKIFAIAASGSVRYR